MKKNKHFKQFAARLVQQHAVLPGVYLMESGPEEQAAEIVAALKRLDGISPLDPAEGATVNLSTGPKGALHIPVRYTSTTRVYVLLSDIVHRLDWSMVRAHAWAEEQNRLSLEQQRAIDEARGDGQLGWDGLRDTTNLGIWLSYHQDEGKRNWHPSGDYCDWLVSQQTAQGFVSCWRTVGNQPVDVTAQR
jgi:hypothetical protein